MDRKENLAPENLALFYVFYREIPPQDEPKDDEASTTTIIGMAVLALVTVCLLAVISVVLSRAVRGLQQQPLRPVRVN